MSAVVNFRSSFHGRLESSRLIGALRRKGRMRDEGRGKGAALQIRELIICLARPHSVVAQIGGEVHEATRHDVALHDSFKM